MTEPENQSYDPVPISEDPRFPNEHNVMPKVGEETNPSSPPFDGIPFDAIRPPDHDKQDAFDPHNDNAFDEVKLKGQIKRRKDGDYLEQTGYIYWRRCPDFSSSSSSLSSSSSSSSSSDSSSSGSSGSSSSDSSGSSSSDSPSSGSSSSGSPSSASSSKSTCIVTVPTWFRETGNTALFNIESPEVRFLDWDMRVPIKGRYTTMPIDTGFSIVSEDETVKVYSVIGEKAQSFGAKTGNGFITIDAGFFWRFGNKEVIVSLVSTRDTFASNPTDDPFFDPRFPERTDEQRICNENKINEAYDQVGKNRRP